MKNKRIVLISGASSGIGSAACKIFSQKGWYVVGVARRHLKTTKYIDRYCQADLSLVSEVNDVIESINTKEKRLDCLVNNAAYQVCKPLIATGLEEWRKVFALNVEAPFLLAQGLYHLLVKSKGSIVNVASVHAQASSGDISSYAASKGALVSLTRNMAIEFGPQGIRVNAIIPGAVKTPMLEEGVRRVCGKNVNVNQQLKSLGEKHILRRIGKPEDVAQAILFLADQSASFITGQTLVVDGGALAKLSTE